MHVLALVSERKALSVVSSGPIAVMGEFHQRRAKCVWKMIGIDLQLRNFPGVEQHFHAATGALERHQAVLLGRCGGESGILQGLG